MLLEIHHETQLEYSAPVSELLAEVRLEPASDENQSVRTFHLAVAPQSDVYRFHDGFGNRVHHFNMLPSCREVRMVAASVVETHPLRTDWTADTSTFPLLEESISLPARAFLGLGESAKVSPVNRSDLLAPILAALRPSEGTRLGQLVMDIAGYISTHFEYAKHVTLATSPIDDVLVKGKGVCQDFTHLMIAIVRAFNIPARYVSGYIHRQNKESQSHAWCEVWLPQIGWFGVDPTNNRAVDENFVKVATGRDFTDVPPNKGVYRGKAEESIRVRVETQELARLPTLAWQETTPIFEVPLTNIGNRQRYDMDFIDPDQQQQQQQQ